MTRLAWDGIGDRTYERGVDKGVLYVDGSDGVAWNGIISVSEKPSGGDLQPYYVDGELYYIDNSPEAYAATIAAFSYPDEFEACEGIRSFNTGIELTDQPRAQFSLTYRTIVGNDVQTNASYDLHLIYGARISPSDRDFSSDADKVNPATFSWDIQAVPVPIPGYRGTAHIIIDSATISGPALSSIEDILYGTDVDQPRMPTLAELSAAIDAFADLVVTDLGDGTAVITGTGVTDIDANTYTIDWPSVVEIDANTYSVSSS